MYALHATCTGSVLMAMVVASPCGHSIVSGRWQKKSLGKISGKGFTSAEPVSSRDSIFLTLSECTHTEAL